MGLPYFSAVSLAEIKRSVPASGPDLDTFLCEEAGRWTRAVEDNLSRRLVFRAPTENATSILTATAWATSTPAATGSPASPGRTLVVTFPSTATSGIITITGTVAGVAGVTEAFDCTSGSLVQYGVKFFTAVSGIAITTANGSGNVTIGTSVGYVEYHTVQPASWHHRPLEWPVQQVLTVHEDAARAYGSTTLLAATDYELHSPFTIDRRLTRVSSLTRRSWSSYFRAVRDVYSAGYFTLANVPGPIKDVILDLIGRSVRYSQTGRQGLASGSDGTGSFALDGPPMITAGMNRRLDAFRRWSFGAETGERDFDLEAA